MDKTCGHGFTDLTPMALIIEKVLGHFILYKDTED